jgi:hypothetical protein
MCNEAFPKIKTGKSYIGKKLHHPREFLQRELRKHASTGTAMARGSNGSKEIKQSSQRRGEPRIPGAFEDGLRKPKSIGAATSQRSESKLRETLLAERRKDVLLIPRAWYPEDMPIDSTAGWWYVPTEAVIGRLCRRCNTFRDKAEFTSNECGMMNKANCRNCQRKEPKCTKRNEAKRRKMSERQRSMERRSPCADSAKDIVRKSDRIRHPAKYALEDRSDDNSDSEEEPRQFAKFQSTLGIKLRAADPRYISHADDYHRGDIVMSVSEAYELLRLKMELSEEVAMVWLTTADMGFSLTDEDM